MCVSIICTTKNPYMPQKIQRTCMIMAKQKGTTSYHIGTIFSSVSFILVSKNFKPYCNIIKVNVARLIESPSRRWSK